MGLDWRLQKITLERRNAELFSFKNNFLKRRNKYRLNHVVVNSGGGRGGRNKFEMDFSGKNRIFSKISAV